MAQLGYFVKLSVFAVCIGFTWQAGVAEDFKSCDSACKEKPMDVTFVIDASSSIWPENFTLGLWFVEDFVEIFKIDPKVVRVAIVSYGDKVYTDDAFGFNEHLNLAELKQAITNLPYRAGLATETGAAIAYARDVILLEAREGIRKVVIVLTDGNSQRTQVTSEQARITRKSGVEMFVVGVGHQVSEQELRNIAGVDDNVFVVTSYNLLGTVRSRLAFEVCGVNPPLSQIVCRDNPVDISFVIDASSSIGHDNFSIGMDFVKQFVQNFDISPQRARFSVITYGRGIYEDEAFGLDTYSDEQELVDAITGLPYTAGSYTDTGMGIAYMRDQQMLPKQRPHAAHIAIVLTDGNSQDWERTQDEAAASRSSGITIFAIGVGVHLSSDELYRIAGSADTVFEVADYKALDTIKQELDDKTCAIVLDKFHADLKQ